jgi:hypothetical protein
MPRNSGLKGRDPLKFPVLDRKVLGSLLKLPMLIEALYLRPSQALNSVPSDTTQESATSSPDAESTTKQAQDRRTLRPKLKDFKPVQIAQRSIDIQREVVTFFIPKKRVD